MVTRGDALYHAHGAAAATPTPPRLPVERYCLLLPRGEVVLVTVNTDVFIQFSHIGFTSCVGLLCLSDVTTESLHGKGCTCWARNFRPIVFLK